MFGVCQMNVTLGFREKARAAGIHFGISFLLALLAGALVFWVWYPTPYADISGGREIFGILVSVDVVLGPLLTFVVFQSNKPQRVLVADLGVICVMQIVALFYGLWTVFLARPVYLVHEVDRFQVIVASDIDAHELLLAKESLRRLPINGVRVIGIRKPHDGAEMLKSVELALAGEDVAMQPSWWVELNESHRKIMAERGRPVSDMASRTTELSRDLANILQRAGLSESDVWIFPVTARNSGWSVVIGKERMNVIGYLEVDSF